MNINSCLLCIHLQLYQTVASECPDIGQFLTSIGNKLKNKLHLDTLNTTIEKQPFDIAEDYYDVICQ